MHTLFFLLLLSCNIAFDVSGRSLHPFKPLEHPFRSLGIRFLSSIYFCIRLLTIDVTVDRQVLLLLLLLLLLLFTNRRSAILKSETFTEIWIDVLLHTLDRSQPIARPLPTKDNTNIEIVETYTQRMVRVES